MLEFDLRLLSLILFESLSLILFELLKSKYNFRRFYLFERLKLEYNLLNKKTEILESKSKL